MYVEVRLQPVLVAAFLVQEAVGLVVIGEAARNNVDVEVDVFLAAQPQRRALANDVVLTRERLLGVVVDVLQRLAGRRVVVREVRGDVKIVVFLDERVLGLRAAVPNRRRTVGKARAEQLLDVGPLLLKVLQFRAASFRSWFLRTASKYSLSVMCLHR